MVWSGPLCTYLNTGSVTALTWQAKPKHMQFLLQASGQYAVPSPGSLHKPVILSSVGLILLTSESFFFLKRNNCNIKQKFFPFST